MYLSKIPRNINLCIEIKVEIHTFTNFSLYVYATYSEVLKK